MNKIIAAIVVIAALAACQRQHEPERAAPVTITGLTAQAAAPVEVDDLREAAGSVRAKDISVLSSRVMGAVTVVYVMEGDRVRRGQPLISIDSRDLSDRVTAATEGAAEAQAALASATKQKELADATYTRYKALYEGKALSRQEMDTVETSRAVAENELSRARAAVARAEAGRSEASVYAGFSRIASPMDGIVTSRSVDPGTMAAPGMPLMTVEGGGGYHIEADLDESLINTVGVGTEARVRIDSIGRELEGRVTEAVGHVDPATRTFRVKVALTDPGVRGGMFGRVSFKAGTRKAILVPASAIITKGQLTGVYIAGADGVISYRLIKTGREYPEGTEAVSGINPGDRVIVEGAERAVEGGRMEARR